MHNPTKLIQGPLRVQPRFSPLIFYSTPLRIFQQFQPARNIWPHLSTLISNRRPARQSSPYSYPSRHFASGSAVHKNSNGVASFLLTDVGEGIAEVEVLKWYIKEGDEIKEFDRICEVQSDKANVEIPSRYSGRVEKIYYKEGEVAKVGLPLIDIFVGDKVVGGHATAHEPAVAVEFHNSQSALFSSEKILSTPAVRHLAKMNNVDLSKIKSTGKGGRISKEDVLNFLANTQKQDSSAPTAPVSQGTVHSSLSSPSTTNTSSSSSTLPSISGESDTVTPIRGFSRTMVKTMTAAAQIPLFHYSDEIYMDELHHLRDDLRKIAEKIDVKLTYMPFMVKAASLALKQYPLLNSSLMPSQTEIVLRGSHNIGVAMATSTGLVVPNVKNVQFKSILDIAQELNNLQRLAKENRLSVADLSGGTFTLSNIGTIGGTFAVPVVTPPEVAIGAIGKIQKVPRYDKDNILVPMQVMTITWSADHRVIDGATIAHFSNSWKHFLEHPNHMFLHL